MQEPHAIQPLRCDGKVGTEGGIRSKELAALLSSTLRLHWEPSESMPQTVVVPNILALAQFVGSPLGPSSWLTVSQERIDDFARATGDDQWIHVDGERAKQDSPFGRTIAHGYLTLSLAHTMLPEIFKVENCSHIVNYGVERVRLREPVPSESRIRLNGEVRDVRKVSGGAARVAISLRCEAENVRRPVCTGEGIYIFFP